MTAETVSAAVPELVSVNVCCPLLPTFTLPSATLVGLTLNPGSTPVAESATEAGELEALLVIVSEPLALPVAVAANVTVRLALAPAAMVAGTCNPLTLNPAPVAATWETFTPAVPELVIVRVFCELLPTFTLPKATAAGAASVLVGLPPLYLEEPVVAACKGSPPQPASHGSAIATASAHPYTAQRIRRDGTFHSTPPATRARPRFLFISIVLCLPTLVPPTNDATSREPISETAWRSDCVQAHRLALVMAVRAKVGPRI